MLKFVTPTVEVSPLKIPPHATVPLKVIFRALVLVVPTGNPAAFALLQTDGVAVNAVLVDHSAILLSHVPSVYLAVPLLSQYQTAADAVCVISARHAFSADNAITVFLIIVQVGWIAVFSPRQVAPAPRIQIVVMYLGLGPTDKSCVSRY